MKYAIVTGTSKGLGASIAKLLIQAGIHVIGIARNDNKELNRLAVQSGVTYRHEACDLSQVNEVEQLFTSLANQLFANGDAKLVYLINNAAVVGPIDTAGNHDAKELADHVHINLLAPMISMNVFLEYAVKKDIPLIIANVTSGAANRSQYGWSAYSSSKAGLDRFTKTTALEQVELQTRNKAILFNPSIMDSQMQQEIRSTNEAAFQDVEKFRKYKENNSLRDTDVVAGALVQVLLDTDKIESGKNYNVNELLS